MLTITEEGRKYALSQEYAERWVQDLIESCASVEFAERLLENLTLTLAGSPEHLTADEAGELLKANCREIQTIYEKVAENICSLSHPSRWTLQSAMVN